METYIAVFRLENLPFPKAEGTPGAEKALDPLAPHPVTRAANRRAVRRAWAMYRRAIGRDEALRAVRSIHVWGERVRAGGAATEPEPLEETDVRPESAGDRAAARPAVGSPDEGVSHDAARAAALERTIRWGLLDAESDPVAAGWEVVGGDEVRGRVAVVIERSVDGGGRWRVCFDDADGRLLRVAFGDPASGRRVRYEYDDYRRAGPVKLPHRRWLYYDGTLYAEDRFEEVRVSSGAS